LTAHSRRNNILPGSSKQRSELEGKMGQFSGSLTLDAHNRPLAQSAIEGDH
jgi:hypothetical protein